MQPTPTTFEELVDIFLEIIQVIVPILYALALLVFIWGLVKFIFRVGGDSDKALAAGKKLMTWGLLALFIMVSIWGILALFYDDFGFTNSFGLPLLPE